jgi:hypothetical protein
MLQRAKDLRAQLGLTRSKCSLHERIRPREQDGPALGFRRI